MGRYRLQEADIEIPDHWSDNSINAFLMPSKANGTEATLVVTRDYSHSEQDVLKFADDQLVEAAKKLTAYKLLDRRLIEIAKQATVQLDYVWTTSDRISVRQRQTYVKTGGTFVILTLTAREADFPEHEGSWALVTQSLHLMNS